MTLSHWFSRAFGVLLVALEALRHNAVVPASAQPWQATKNGRERELAKRKDEQLLRTPVRILICELCNYIYCLSKSTI